MICKTYANKTHTHTHTHTIQHIIRNDIKHGWLCCNVGLFRSCLFDQTSILNITCSVNSRMFRNCPPDAPESSTKSACVFWCCSSYALVVKLKNAKGPRRVLGGCRSGSIFFLLTSHPIFDNVWPQKTSFWQKTHFWRTCHVKNYENVSFFRKKKAPAGATTYQK